MKRVRFAFALMVAALLVGLLWSCGSDSNFKYEQDKNDLMETRIYTLDNGLKVYMSVNKETPRIQASIAVHVGSQNDPAETTGLSHYLEHLMFKGTHQYGTMNYAAEAPLLDTIESLYEYYRTLTDPAERAAVYHAIDSVSYLASTYAIPNEYDKLMAAIGSTGTNAYTSFDQTVYIENIPANQIDNWAKIQADRFENMVIRGFHTELEAVYEEKNISMDNDDRRIFDTIMFKLFPNHAYGLQTTLGTQEHLKNPSIVNIKNHYNTYYVPNNMAICMAGDFNPDSAIQIINKYFGTLKPNPNLPARTTPQLVQRTEPAEAQVIGKQAAFMYMGWPLPGAKDPDCYLIDVVANLLNNGMAGLLDVNINQPMKALESFAFNLDMTDYSALILGAYPKSDQELEELKDLLLEQVANLRSGNFNESLLKAIINNERADRMRTLESNKGRVNYMLDAFINQTPWSETVNLLDRMKGITKQQIVDFANKYLSENSYVVVYKRQGENKFQQTIEKPAITPIKMNRDTVSAFVAEVQANKPVAIEPQFVDVDKDIDKSEAREGVRLILTHNPLNTLFQLSYVFDFGERNSRTLSLAANYEDYIGSEGMTRQQLNDSLFQLAGSYYISVGNRQVRVSISGLNENIEQTVELVEKHLRSLVVDKEAYQKFAQSVLKARQDAKLDQNASFRAAVKYAIYGPENPFNTLLSNEEVVAIDPQVLVDEIKGLLDYPHSVLYYTPDEKSKAIELLAKMHPQVNPLKTPPALLHDFKLVVNEQPKVYFVNYPSEQVLMAHYGTKGDFYSLEKTPYVNLYNEYFGGPMNSVVFQELREARALAYSAGAFYTSPDYLDVPYYMTTFIGTQVDKLGDAVAAFNDILINMPVSQKSFDVAKEARIATLRARRTTNRSLANFFLSLEHLGLKEDPNKYLFDKYPTMTLEDVVKFQNETVKNNVFSYVVLGNAAKVDMNVLKKLGPVTTLSEKDIFGF